MQTTHIRAVARKTVLFITGFWLAALSAQGQHPAISKNIQEEKAVLQTERKLLQAFINGDGDALNHLLADNYRSYNGLSKHEIIIDPQPMPNASFDTSSLKARLFGDSAEVTGVLLIKSQRYADMYWQVVDRMVKHPTGWRSVTSQREMMPVWEGKFLTDSEMTLLTPLSCAQQSGLKSLNSNQSAMLKFTNTMAQPVIIRWLNFDGELDSSLHLINTILPGEYMVIMTFVTHPFVVMNKAGNCLRIFQPNAKPSLAVIK